VRDDASVTDQERLSFLKQEINHARQRRLGPLSQHLGQYAKSFVGTPVGIRGRQNLWART